MIKKVQVYKQDKWNMINVEVHGKTIKLSDITDQWGEQSHTFLSRPEMMKWVEQRFAPGSFEGDEAERLKVIEAFRNI